ncbi:MAG: hypothetical protein JSU87_11875 [Gemmatimonadota bacterium]|nr:MAG: hypothetical protein JSU87_11875 [Gemmatimonadota bacterium]
MRHMEWADSLVWESVLALPEARSDAALRERLYHSHIVQWAYLQIWRGEPLEMREASSFEDLRAIHAWVRDYYRQVAALLAEEDEGALRREIRFPWAQQLVERWGSARSATFVETLIQIASHTSYHRGQINTRLRELGGKPPLTDFIAWIWMGRPAPAWEAPTA